MAFLQTGQVLIKIKTVQLNGPVLKILFFFFFSYPRLITQKPKAICSAVLPACCLTLLISLRVFHLFYIRISNRKDILRDRCLQHIVQQLYFASDCIWFAAAVCLFLPIFGGARLFD